MYYSNVFNTELGFLIGKQEVSQDEKLFRERELNYIRFIFLMVFGFGPING